ncbi:ABC transporter permease [Rhodovulum sp. DZ06]|uniref:ABC transporter permease n=1 Tax=Rhodovulum sp. DZ06 TaxID=3425126 RepID=UPI003D354A62
MEKRPASFYVLSAFFALFILFLYGPTITIAILSFQGPEGGLTFPMRGASLYWFKDLFEEQAVGDIWGAFGRSLVLGLMVMVTTLVVSVLGGMAFRQRFTGSTALFYLIIASLVIPSILVSLGVGLIFQQAGLKVHWATSGFGSQLTWTLPFGLLIMFAVFNRFDKAYEEAARDQGATAWQTFWYITLPMIAPSLIGVGLFGFTLSYDEFARTLLTAGSYNTLPLEIFGMTTNVTTPVIYALGTLTTLFSFIVIGTALAAVMVASRRKAKRAAIARAAEKAANAGRAEG